MYTHYWDAWHSDLWKQVLKWSRAFHLQEKKIRNYRWTSQCGCDNSSFNTTLQKSYATPYFVQTRVWKIPGVDTRKMPYIDSNWLIRYDLQQLQYRTGITNWKIYGDSRSTLSNSAIEPVILSVLKLPKASLLIQRQNDSKRIRDSWCYNSCLYRIVNWK